MAKIEEKLLDMMTIEELLDLEEKIMKVIHKKIKEEKCGDWKRDFLDISAWTHLNDKTEVRVDKWPIETF